MDPEVAPQMSPDQRRHSVHEPPKGAAWLAWLVILGLVTFIVWRANLPPDGEPGIDQSSTRPAATTQPAAAKGHQQTELVGKLLVGAKTFLSREMIEQYSGRILKNAEELQTGSVPDQLRYVALVAEFEGVAAGLDELSQIEERNSASELSLNRVVISDVRAILTAHANTAPVTLDDDVRTRLARELGWFAELLPLLDGTLDTVGRDQILKDCRSVFWGLITIGVWYVVGGLIGAVLLILLLVFLLSGKLKIGMSQASSCSGVYAEAFALWLAITMGVRFGMDRLPPSQALADFSLLISMASSLVITGIALAWPVVRGVPWQRVRTDLGLRLGEKPWREFGAGLLTYLCALPILLMGLGLVFVLMQVHEWLTGTPPMPSHPIVEKLVNADWATIVQIMVLGVIVAPLVEEIMFRGALYRQLRDSTRWLGFVGSALISAFVSSAIFAAIHPQGWVFIPALSSLALAFCLAREWRGNLPACIVAHGLNNLITLSLNVLLFS